MEAPDKEALFRKYRAGNCSKEELAALLSYFDHEGYEPALRKLIADTFSDIPKDRTRDERAAHIASAVRANLIDQLQQETKKKRFLHHVIGKYATVAAAIAVALTLGILIYLRQTKVSVETRTTRTATVDYDIPAGGNRAMLTLPDGRIVPLSHEKKGIRIDSRVRYDDGSIVTGMATTIQPQWLALVTPRGGQYHVELPDGSHVWLNAASKLSYPTRFDGHNRVVELEGEAYFEVAKQARPFLVKTNSQTIRVLGTQFNVSAYADDGQTVTTLVKGSVNVSLMGQRTEISLMPGEQSVVKNQSIHKAKVDVVQFINWKSGHFSFRETEMHQVMRQLSRWYNITVDIDPHIPPTYFYADIKRDRSLSQVLNILKKGGVNFKIIQKPAGPQLVVIP